MRSKFKIIMPICVAVAVIILAFVFIRFKTEQKENIGAMISTAQQYLTEQKYEQAIAKFQKIIEIDHMNVEAYLGLAEAYEKSGDPDKAYEVLEEGYEKTNDDRIESRIKNRNTVSVTTADSAYTTVTEKNNATSMDYSNAELTEVLKQLIEDPDMEIEQSKLDAIRYVRIIGKDFIYAGIDDNYTENIETYGYGDGNAYTLTFFDKTQNEYLYGECKSLSFLSRLKNLVGFGILYNKISDISALSNLTNLTSLILGGNQISDISALSNLTNLTFLYLGSNQISDISVLSNLTNLTYLDLDTNQISDISALSNLTNLTFLNLYGNQISDISVLSNLTNLTSLDLYDNQISREDVDMIRESLTDCDIEN